MPKPLSSDWTALLLLELGRQRSVDVRRETTRFMVSAVTIRRLSGRSALRTAFLEELADSCFERGWLFFSLGDRFALVQVSAVNSWPFIASKRLAPLLKRVRASTKEQEEVFDELAARFPFVEDVGDEEE